MTGYSNEERIANQRRAFGFVPSSGTRPTPPPPARKPTEISRVTAGLLRGHRNEPLSKENTW